MKPEDIRYLKELQNLDIKIHNSEEEKRQKPRILEAPKRKLALTHEQHEASRQNLKKFRIEADKKELDLKSNEEKTNKLSVQINLAKTNKEYAIFQKELNNLKSDNSVLEDETLGLFAQAEETQHKLTLLDKDIAETQKQIEQLSREVETTIHQLDQELEKLRQKRTNLISQISFDVIAGYEKILQHKLDRVALAQAIDGTCQGCHMDLAPQDINNLMKLKEVVVCRNCSRMLYL